MRVLRLVGSVLLLVALVAAVTRTTSSAASTAPDTHCTQADLGAAFTAPLKLQSFQKFGCVDSWAFTWATIGTGQAQVGVTEVLQYLPIEQSWMIVSRALDCKPDVLPKLVYREGCFSN